MKKLIYLVAAFSAILTSCSNEDVISGTPQSPTSSTITATISQKGTRVAMGEKYEEDGDYYNPLLWEAGDAIRVINYFTNAVGQYTTSDSGNTAIFNKTSGEDVVEECLYIGVYPASAWTGAFTQESPLMFTFPKEQNYTSGTVDRNAFPMVGLAEGTNFEFSSAAPILRLNVKTTSTTANVNSITITSKSNILSGTFNRTSDFTPVEGEKSTTLVCAQPVAINSTTGVDFCVVVPANSYDGGDLTITVNTDNGSFEKTSKSNMNLDEGSVYDIDIVVGDPMPPTTGTAKATIGGAEVDVNWVQLWENGPKFAEYNVGVTDGKAESYGGYYCWGSSIDKDSNGAFKSGTDALTGTDDTATNLWGNNWRMPTKAELDDLLANCDVAWTTVNGVYGSKFTGKGDFASNSVFLPATGCFEYGYVNGRGNYSYYWSSTPIGSGYAYLLYLVPSSQYVNGDDREYGYSVRAVLK